ncbi:MAG: hypothetical protein BGO39_26945 [Chloroflexi bacterium 54-19]|nr:MAG: hypothetical protein BGO39_26945 [Chloroflexi bacterium 54-19]
MEWVILGIAFLLFLLVTGSQTARYRAEIRRLEQKIDLLSRKLDMNNGKEPAWGREQAVSNVFADTPAGEPLRSSWDNQQPFGQPNIPGFSPAGSKPSLSPEVHQLVMNKQKIQAIKLVREQTGLGLKEAKDLVDAYEKEIRQGY